MCQEKNISKLLLKRKGPYYMFKYLIQKSVLAPKSINTFYKEHKFYKLTLTRVIEIPSSSS